MQLDRKNLKVVRWLKEELDGCESVLDLGCGQSSMFQYVEGVKYSLGVEYFKPYIDESLKQGIHTEYINYDVTKLGLPEAQFEAVMLVDVLEHIEKEDALELLEKMKHWARKNVVVIVPNGFLPQGDTYGDGNEKQHHVSGWTPEELEDLGYRVKGFGGWRPLRGDGADIIPTKTRAGHYFLAGLSLLTEPIVQIAPEYAFHLFAVWER